MGQTREPVLVEALIAEPAVERFDVGVLIRFTRLDQAQRDTAVMRPGQHRLATELLGVVGAENPREATYECQPIEGASHRPATEGTSAHDGHGFRRGIIHDGQTLDDASISGPVEDEVGRPHVVRHLRAHQGLPIGHRNLLPPSAPNLELGLRVQAFDAFMVDVVAFLPQLQIDHPGAIATVTVGEGNNPPAKRHVLIR